MTEEVKGTCERCGKPSGKYRHCYSCKEDVTKEVGIRDAVAVRVAAAVVASEGSTHSAEEVAEYAHAVAEAVVKRRRPT